MLLMKKMFFFILLSIVITQTQAESVLERDFIMKSKVQGYNTILSFSQEAEGLELYRSLDYDCDIENYSACWNGMYNVIDDSPIIDSMNRKYYTFKDGSKKKKIITPESPRNVRRNHHMVWFKDRLWAIGGSTTSGFDDPRISVSDDSGLTWRFINSTAPIFADRFQAVVVFNDKIWVIGGTNTWSSIDGEEWLIEASQSPFGNRTNFQVVKFENKLWLIGGKLAGNTLQDVWSSVDGRTWVEEATSTAMGPISAHQTIIHNGLMWTLGGDGFDSKVWSSSDGVNWNMVTADAAYGERQFFKSTVYDDKIWLFGGYSYIDGLGSKTNSDIWSSSDGILWNLEEQYASFGDRVGFSVASNESELLVFGGIFRNIQYRDGGAILGDTWYSQNGREWFIRTTQAEFSPRGDHQVLEYDHKLWVLGGYSRKVGYHASGLRGDVWSSLDGVEWELENYAAEFGPRASHQSVAFKDKVWVIGGEVLNSVEGTEKRNDVWSSLNGITWSQEIADAGFSGRSNFKAIVFDNRIWIIGGVANDGSQLNDIWSSPDGVTWNEESSSAAFSPRYNHEVVVFDSKLWLLGGVSTDTDELKDVWSSIDGVNWELETDVAWVGAQGSTNKIVVFADKFWAFKGKGLREAPVGSGHRVWSSLDGINWDITGDAGTFPGQLVVFEDQMWVIGGTKSKSNSWVLGTSNQLLSSGDGVNWKTNYHRTLHFESNYFDIDSEAFVGGAISPVSGSFVEGGSASFEVIADPGYIVENVLGCNGVLTGSLYSISQVTADCTISAIFSEQITFEVSTVVKMGKGSLSPSDLSVPLGQSATFQVTPQSGYQPYYASGCEGELSDSKELYVTGPVTEDCEISIYFIWKWW